MMKIFSFMREYLHISKFGYSPSIDDIDFIVKAKRSAKENRWIIYEDLSKELVHYKFVKKLYDKKGLFLRQVDIYWYMHNSDEQYFVIDDSRGVLPQQLNTIEIEDSFNYMLRIIESLEPTEQALHGGRVYITEHGAVMQELE